MIVTFPSVEQHCGYAGYLVTYNISDLCPKCGAKRGIERWQGLSYDGSRRLAVDCWKNECGHIDKYSELRAEVQRSKLIPISHGQPTQEDSGSHAEHL